MDEIEGRPEDDAPRDDAPRDPAPRSDEQGERQPDAQPRFGAPGDFRPRRRGRRGRGGGSQRFGPGPRPPLAPGGANEEDSQARELAAYERRQQQRGRPQFRGPGWVAGARPAPSAGAPRGGAFRPGGGVGAGPAYR
ncbi:MAG TPA: hypothetical protein VEU77_13290, partial [Candidatus Acidoferrales bacterium]|nr:hypothetical protein [Candidatus Acidoferrales bacterium]